MAKKFTITAAKNGGSGVQKDVIVQDSECNLNIGFLWRLHEAYELTSTDTISISSISGPVNANNPIGGFSAINPVILVAVATGQISLAFIEG